MVERDKISVTYLTNCYAPPDQVNVGAATRHYYHVQAIADAGLNVDVVTASRSTISSTSISSSENQSSVSVDCVPNRAIRNNRVISRAGYHIEYFLRSLWRSLRTHKPKLVVASIPSLLIGWQGYIVSRLHKANLLIDVRDLWTDSLSTTSLSKIPFFLAINRVLEKILYRRANVIICTSEAQKKEIRKLVAEKVPVYYVPNGLDLEIMAVPTKPHPLIEKIRKKYRWVCVYAGKHSRYTGLDALLTAAKRLEEDGLAFLLVGGGYTKEELVARTKKDSLTNVFFHEAVPKKEIGCFLANADIFFISYSNADVWGKVLPNKLFDYMYWNRPIIASVVPGEITRVIAENRAGIAVRPGDPDAIVDAGRQCLRNIPWKINSRAYLLEHFDRQNCKKLFVEACQKALN
jgi:glycosyltransferase involved in cell wall biosynthesis